MDWIFSILIEIYAFTSEWKFISALNNPILFSSSFSIICEGLTSAFTFSFISCFYLYLKTRIEFKKQEKIYLLEFGSMEIKKIKFKKRKESTEEALSIN